MPIYEYRCQSCSQVSSFFTRAISSPLSPACKQCQGTHMVRQMSRFAQGRSQTSSQHDLNGNSGRAGLDYYRDPRNIGRNVEESFSRHGLDMPETVRETIDTARNGELPKGLDI